ncbi:unnamed protein product, partial [Polarella glacialis]
RLIRYVNQLGLTDNIGSLNGLWRDWHVDVAAMSVTFQAAHYRIAAEYPHPMSQVLFEDVRVVLDKNDEWRRVRVPASGGACFHLGSVAAEQLQGTSAFASQHAVATPTGFQETQELLEASGAALRRSSLTVFLAPFEIDGPMLGAVKDDPFPQPVACCKAADMWTRIYWDVLFRAPTF